MLGLAEIQQERDVLPSQPQPKDTDFCGTSNVVGNVAKQQN